MYVMRYRPSPLNADKLRSRQNVLLGPPILLGGVYPRFWTFIFKSHLLPSMWPIFVEFRSASLEDKWRNDEKTKKEESKNHIITVKRKSADKYVGRPKNKKIAFWATVWGLRRRTHSIYSFLESPSSTSRPIRHNCKFFAISYTLDVISRNLSKSAFSKQEWVALTANFRWKGASPKTTVGVRELHCNPRKNTPICFCHIFHKT